MKYEIRTYQNRAGEIATKILFDGVEVSIKGLRGSYKDIAIAQEDALSMNSDIEKIVTKIEFKKS